MLAALSALTLLGAVAAELGDGPLTLKPLPRRSNVPPARIGIGGVDLELQQRDSGPSVAPRDLNGSVIALGSAHK